MTKKEVIEAIEDGYNFCAERLHHRATDYGIKTGHKTLNAAHTRAYNKMEYMKDTDDATDVLRSYNTTIEKLLRKWCIK